MAKRMKLLSVVLVLCILGIGSLSAQIQNKKFFGPADQTYYMCTFVSGVEYWVAAFEGFKDAAKRGALHVVGGGMTSPDTLLPETELLARDFLHGLLFAESLGAHPTAAWLPVCRATSRPSSPRKPCSAGRKWFWKPACIPAR